jgi:hypothetical protein
MVGRFLRPDGSWKVGPRCPKCDSDNAAEQPAKDSGMPQYLCMHCGYAEIGEGHDWYRDAPDEGGEG